MDSQHVFGLLGGLGLTILLFVLIKLWMSLGTRSRSDAQGTRSVQDRDAEKATWGLLPPEDLGTLRDRLSRELAALPVVRDGLLESWWDRGPIVTISGVNKAARAIVSNLQEIAARIGRFVANIQALDVDIRPQETFYGCQETGPQAHIVIQMGRRFRNGNSDLVLNHVVRTGEQTFKHARLRD